MGIDVDTVYDGDIPAEVHTAIKAEFAAIDVPGVDSEEMQTLNKYIRVSLRLDDEEERVKAQCAAILKSIESRRNGLDYVYGALVRNVTERLIAGGKARSHKTLWGTIGFRKAPAQVFVKDEAALMGYAKHAHPEWIRIKEEPVRSAIKDYAKTTGDIPPGCEFIDERDKFYVKGTKSAQRTNGSADEPD